MRRVHYFAFVILLILSGTKLSMAGPVYTYTIYPYPGAIGTAFQGINNSGGIVGSYDPPRIQHGFILAGGVATA